MWPLTSAQVFVIDVQYEHKGVVTIYRRFSQFDTLHERILDRCSRPGSTVRTDQIPDLPSKLVVGRSAVRSVAEGRIAQLEIFLKAVINADPYVSQSPAVLAFLETTNDDFNVDHSDVGNNSDEDSPSKPTPAPRRE